MGNDRGKGREGMGKEREKRIGGKGEKIGETSK